MTRRILSIDVARVVCSVWPVTMDELRGPLTHRRIAEARHAAYWLASRATGRSMPVLGRAFRRDHTTIWHGIRAVDSGRWDQVPGFRDRLIKAEGLVALLKPVHGPDVTEGWPNPVSVAATFQSVEVLG